MRSVVVVLRIPGLGIRVFGPFLREKENSNYFTRTRFFMKT
jgi:hypothetical protein